MDEKRNLLLYLEKNYGNINHELYNSGITKIYNYFNGRLTIPEIEKFLSTNYTYTIYRQAKKPKNRNPTYVYKKRFQFQVDTIFIEKLKSYNSNFSYILTVIDIWSRFAFCRLMKTKTARETVACMEDIFKEAKDPPDTILFDRGTELKNKQMTNLLNKLNIKIYSSSTNVHAPFVERFNYTIQTMISKYMCQNNTYSFYKSFQKIVQNYNSKVHSALKISPAAAELSENQSHVLEMHKKKFRKHKKKKPKYKIGEKVRISTQKNKFSRGYAPQFSKYINLNS